MSDLAEVAILFALLGAFYLIAHCIGKFIGRWYWNRYCDKHFPITYL